MIQRVQTLYFLVASILLYSLFFFTLAEINSTEGNLYILRLSGLFEEYYADSILIEKIVPLWFIVFVCATLSIVTVFLFRQRLLQIRISIFNILMMIGFYILFGFYIYTFKSRFNADVSLSYGLIFPIIAAILTFFGARGVRKDELIVRSYNRIR